MGGYKFSCSDNLWDKLFIWWQKLGDEEARTCACVSDDTDGRAVKDMSGGMLKHGAQVKKPENMSHCFHQCHLKSTHIAVSH